MRSIEFERFPFRYDFEDLKEDGRGRVSAGSVNVSGSFRIEEPKIARSC